MESVTMMKNKKARRGFTLPEVLVTLAIVATLSAVLLPALNNQLSKGDAGRLTSDLVAVQTAVGAFTSDVRRYPLDLTDLIAKPGSADLDVLGNAFGAVLINKWRGPYLSKELSGTNLPTGYGVNISGTFTRTSYNAIEYLTITIPSLTAAEFNNIDQIIDETANSSTGQLRFTVSGTSTTTTFYAAPIQ
ncbi:MAG: type II secretion system protein [Gemmatimonadaceae bacterium]